VSVAQRTGHVNAYFAAGGPDLYSKFGGNMTR